MHLFLRFFLRKCEIGTNGFRTYFAILIIQLRFNDDNVPLYFFDGCTQHDMGVFRIDWFPVAGFHFRGYSCCLQFTEYDPSTNLIQQNGLNTTMQCINPTLIPPDGASRYLRFPRRPRKIPFLLRLHYWEHNRNNCTLPFLSRDLLSSSCFFPLLVSLPKYSENMK